MNIDNSGKKVEGDIYNDGQEAKEDISNIGQKAKEDIYNIGQKAGKDISNIGQEAKEDIYNNEQTANRDIFNTMQKCGGKYYIGLVKLKKYPNTTKIIRKAKDDWRLTLPELMKYCAENHDKVLKLLKKDGV